METDIGVREQEFAVSATARANAISAVETLFASCARALEYVASAKTATCQVGKVSAAEAWTSDLKSKRRITTGCTGAGIRM